MRYYYFGKAIGNQSTVKNSIRQVRLSELYPITLTRTQSRISEEIAKDNGQQTQGKNPCPRNQRTLAKWREKRSTYSSNHLAFQLRPKFPVGPKRLICQKLKNGRRIRKESWQIANTKLRDDWPLITGSFLTIAISICIHNVSSYFRNSKLISTKMSGKPNSSRKTLVQKKRSDKKPPNTRASTRPLKNFQAGQLTCSDVCFKLSQRTTGLTWKFAS